MAHRIWSIWLLSYKLYGLILIPYNVILACENDDNLKTLEEFKGTVGGLVQAITDLLNTMANSPQSYKDLGSELESMMTTIDELVQVKQCDFISQEYAKITRKRAPLI